MKKFTLCVLGCLIQTSYAAPLDQENVTWIKPALPNTLVREHSSLKEAHTPITRLKTALSFPTQIVRMTAPLNNTKLTCNDVMDKIDDFFTNQISPDYFFYNTILYCSYDIQTNLATGFTINSYFDPLNEEALVYLKKYLAEHDGHDLLGATFKVEKAEALIVSLNIDAGYTDDDGSTYLLLRHDNANYYFESNLAMRLTLSRDIMERFFSRDPRLILPFINQWFEMGGAYQRILSKSNYVELRPELVFLMKDGPRIFNPLLRRYYSHHCNRNGNMYCL